MTERKRKVIVLLLIGVFFWFIRIYLAKQFSATFDDMTRETFFSILVLVSSLPSYLFFGIIATLYSKEAYEHWKIVTKYFLFLGLCTTLFAHSLHDGDNISLINFFGRFNFYGYICLNLSYILLVILNKKKILHISILDSNEEKKKWMDREHDFAMCMSGAIGTFLVFLNSYYFFGFADYSERWDYFRHGYAGVVNVAMSLIFGYSLYRLFQNLKNYAKNIRFFNFVRGCALFFAANLVAILLLRNEMSGKGFGGINFILIPSIIVASLVALPVQMLYLIWKFISLLRKKIQGNISISGILLLTLAMAALVSTVAFITALGSIMQGFALPSII